MFICQCSGVTYCVKVDLIYTVDKAYCLDWTKFVIQVISFQNVFFYANRITKVLFIPVVLTIPTNLYSKKIKLCHVTFFAFFS